MLVAAMEPLVSTLDTESHSVIPRKSDAVLAELRPQLELLGYAVETGKRAEQKIRRPVLFGENGIPKVNYEIDAFHDGHGVALEVEAGRGASNNADYRDILRSALILDATYLALLMPKIYRHGSNPVTTIKAYQNTKNQLDAVFASRRLRLPFEGVLLIGY